MNPVREDSASATQHFKLLVTRNFLKARKKCLNMILSRYRNLRETFEFILVKTLILLHRCKNDFIF